MDETGDVFRLARYPESTTLVLPTSFIQALHLLLWDEIRDEATWKDVLDAVADLKGPRP